MLKLKLKRRTFLRAVVVASGAGLAAGCKTSLPTAAPTAAPSAVPVATEAGATSAATPVAPAEVAIPSGFPVDAPDKPAPLGWKTTMVPPPIKYDPVIEMTQNFDLSPDTRFMEGDDVENNVSIRWSKEMMGLHYQPKWSTTSGEAADAKWSTAMASSDLPDFMVWLGGTRLQQLLDGGALEDITDIWEKTASPLTRQMKHYPDGSIWEYARQNGRLYGIAFCQGADFASDPLMWIRQDWLDQVGMQVPQTIDEFHAAGKAFMDKGLGRMGFSMCSGLVPDWDGWMASVDWLFGAYGVMPGKWLKGDDGKLVYGAVHPACKQPLALLSQWHKEGFISPEFVTTAADKSGDAIVDGQAGIIFGPNWLPEWPLPDSVARDPKANWVFADTPAGPGGKRGRAGTELAGCISAFRKGIDPIKVEASIQQLNWRYEREWNAYENKDYLIFIGQDVVWEGDKLVTGPGKSQFFDPGPGGYPTNFWYEEPITHMRAKVLARDPNTWNAAERYFFSDPLRVQVLAALDLATRTGAEGMHTAFVSLPGPVMKDKVADLNKLEREMFTKIIVGQVPVDGFDGFVAQWLREGGQAVTDEVNAWYAGRSG